MGGYAQTTLTNYEEFFIWVINNTNRHEIKLYAELISEPYVECWDVVSRDWGPGWEDHHPLTAKYPGGLSEGSTNKADGYFGVDYAYDDQGNSPLLGLGKYRITIYENGTPTDAVMFFDLRTGHLGEQISTPDVTFYYDATDKKIYYDRYNKEIVTSETIWNMRDNVYLIPTELEPFPPESFNVGSANNHPMLTWSHTPMEDTYRTGYALYRAYGPIGNPTTSFHKFATVGKYTTSYVDYSFDLGSMWTVYYKMTAINGSRESVFTPTKSINIAIPKTGEDSKEIVFSLNQNYPNPFNPTTTISYSIPSDEHVTLKVYNTLGEEVAELVNEVKIAGVYSTDFNAENLPSGIYFYTIAAGKYTNTKKLLLIK